VILFLTGVRYKHSCLEVSVYLCLLCGLENHFPSVQLVDFPVWMTCRKFVCLKLYELSDAEDLRKFSNTQTDTLIWYHVVGKTKPQTFQNGQENFTTFQNTFTVLDVNIFVVEERTRRTLHFVQN
jgi:hypothetical protein